MGCRMEILPQSSLLNHIRERLKCSYCSRQVGLCDQKDLTP